MPQVDVEPFITANDVAKLIGLTPRGVYDYWYKGIIPGYRLGYKTLRFRLSEVVAALVATQTEKRPKEANHAA